MSIEDLEMQTRRLNAEANKLAAEAYKLQAERWKLDAEERKLQAETQWLPWQIVFAGMLASAGLLAAGAALVKLFFG